MNLPFYENLYPSVHQGMVTLDLTFLPYGLKLLLFLKQWEEEVYFELD